MAEKETVLEISKETLSGADNKLRERIKEDIYEFFLAVLSKARQIAADKESGQESVQVKEAYWTEAKWRTVIRWGGRRLKREYIPDVMLAFFPGLIGFSLSDFQNRSHYFVVGVMGIAIAFILRFYFETKRH